VVCVEGVSTDGVCEGCEYRWYTIRGGAVC